MNKYVVVRGQTVIDTFESLDLTQKYVKDWPGQGLRIMERGLSSILCPFETFDHADGRAIFDELARMNDLSYGS